MFSKIFLGFFGIVACAVLNASPIFQVMPLDALKFPVQMFDNYPGIADYIIKNVSVDATPVNLRLQATHFTQIPSTSKEAKSCPLDGGFILNPGESCVLRLSYQPDQPVTFNQAFPTVCPLASPDNHGCADGEPATVFSTSSTPSHLASFGFSDDQLTLTPNATTLLTITNQSQVTANNVSLKLPASLHSYLTQVSSTSCESIAPNQSCQFKLNMSIHMPVNDLSAEPITLLGSNVAPQSIPVHLAPIQQHPVTITTAPIKQASATALSLISIHNDSDVTISQLSNQLVPPSGVVLDDHASTCYTDPTLEPGQTCDYAYTISDAAFGESMGDITYLPDGASIESQAVSLKVASTQLAVSAPSSSDQTIPAYSSGVITVNNAGAFATQNLQVYKNVGNDWFVVTSSNCPKSLAPGSACSLDYTSSGKQGDEGYLTVSADNADHVVQDLVPATTIALRVDHASAEKHLGYAAIKVSNLTASDVQLTGISAIPSGDLDGHLVLCDAQASNCDQDSRFQSTCLTGGTSGTALAKASSCYLWYQVQKGAIDGDHSAKLTVTFDASAQANNGAPVHFNFPVQVTYGTNLYASGYFYSADNKLVSNIAQWNGASWSGLASNAPDRFDEDFAMQYFHGDLVLGGLFASMSGKSSTSNIALWNGYSWSSIGGASGRVTAFTTLDNHLYAGGLFKQVGSVAANNIAQWYWDDGQAQWQPLAASDEQNGTSNAVTSLASANNKVYVTGGFSRAGSLSALRLASWLPDSSQGAAAGAWQAVGNDSPNQLPRKLYAYKQKLYMGGNFNKIGMNSFNYLAAWNETDWLNVPDNADPGGVSGAVTAATDDGALLYFGGAFTQAFSDGDSVDANGVVAFDPVKKEWLPLMDGTANGVSGGGLVSALLDYDHHLYLAGSFKQAGMAEHSQDIAEWDGQHFSALGDGITKSFSENFSPFVLSLAVAPHVTMQDVDQIQHH
jgi:hypothetical protein